MDVDHIHKLFSVDHGTLSGGLLEKVGEEVALRLRHAHDVMQVRVTLAVRGRLEPRAEHLVSETNSLYAFCLLRDELPVRCPYLYLPVTQSQKLFLIVQEDIGFRRVKALDLAQLLGPSVVDLEPALLLLDHDLLIKLFQELNLRVDFLELELHELLPRVDVNQGHGYLRELDMVEEEHNAIANLEFRNSVVF